MEYKKLGDICDILNGYAFKSDKYVESGIRIIRISNVQKGYIEDKTPAFYPINTVDIEKYMLSENDLLISLTGNVGRVALLDKKFLPSALNQRVACIRTKTDIILKEYLFYMMNSDFFENQCIQSSRGVAQKNMSTVWLENYEVPIYPKEVQLKIVRTLSMLMDIIACYHKQLEKYDELIKARFVEMFGDPITNPMRWEMVSIGDVVKEVKYGTSKPAIEGGKYPYLRMNNLTMDGHLDLSDLKFIDIPNDEIEKYIVRQGDVLFNRTNSVDLVGKTAVFDLPDAMIIAGYIIRIRLNGRLLPEIFSQYMNLEALKSILKNMAKGAVNQANINAQELKKIKIYVPDIQTQRQFIKIKEQIDKSKFVELKYYKNRVEKNK